MITSTIAPRRTDLAAVGRRWWTVPLGFVLGVCFGVLAGVLARLWMRLIADDPAFSWSGTLAIVIAFALFGGGHGLSATVRRGGYGRRGTTAARIAAVVLSLLIFSGAGAMMLPTVAAGALARWRTDWHRVVRAVLALVALPIPVFVAAGIIGMFGWGLHSLSGIAGFVALYGAIILALQPTVAPVPDGWRASPAVRITLLVAPIVLVAAAVVVTVGT